MNDEGKPAEEALASDGYVLLHGCFDDNSLGSLAARLTSRLESSDDVSVLRSRGQMYGSRNLLAAIPDITSQFLSTRVLSFVTGILGKEAGVVRALYFDKPPGRTWSLPWHRDRTIAVQQNDLPSNQFHKPTFKAGIAHVEAPESLLRRMLTLRIHLDPMTAENGPLSVIPSSHTCQADDEKPPVELQANSGDVLAMRPLLSHSSSSSSPETNLHRRIVHIELAPHVKLPDGYKWHSFIPLAPRPTSSH